MTEQRRTYHRNGKYGDMPLELLNTTISLTLSKQGKTDEYKEENNNRGHCSIGSVVVCCWDMVDVYTNLLLTD